MGFYQCIYNELFLTWDGCAGASYYKIYKQYNDSSTRSVCATTADAATSYRFCPIDLEVGFILYVTAVYVDEQGTHESALSDGVSFYLSDPGPDLWPPDAPVNVQLTHANGRFHLTWDDSGDGSDFRVYCQKGDEPTLMVASTSQTSYDCEYAQGVTYNFNVVSYNWYGESSGGSSNRVSFNVAPTPQGITASYLSNHNVQLCWQAVASPISAYRVERASGGGEFTVLQAVDPTTSTVVDATTSAGGLYTYRVFSVNDYGDSESSPCYQLCAFFPPASVQAALVSDGTVRLNWSAVAPGAQYYVYRSTSPTDPGAVCAGVTGDLTLDDGPGLAEDAQYYYRIIAYWPWGSGFHTSSSDPVMCYTPPRAPTLDAVQALSNSSLKLSWPAVASASSGYEVYRSPNPRTTTYTLVGFTLAPPYVDATGLGEATHYWYKVRSRGVRGNSGLSAEASGWTAPNQPTGLRVTAEAMGTGRQMALTWMDNSARESGYVVERSASGGAPWRQFTLGPGAGVGSRMSWRDSSGEVEEGRQYFYRVRALLNPAN